MLKVKYFQFNPFQENTYLVWNEDLDCAVIDPGMYNAPEREAFETFIAENKLNPVLLLNTHCHIDHVLGNAFVAERYGLVPQTHSMEAPVFRAAPATASMYGVPYDPSPDPEWFSSDSLTLGPHTFDILFVPGHSPGHVAFHCAREKVLFSGDVLFRESIGRTDLPGGDMNTLLASIRNVLFDLDPETKVFPGHMGPTTIAHEKKHNPFLASFYQG